MIVSIHMEKCGGTTMAGIWREWFKARFVHLDSPDRVGRECLVKLLDGAKCVHGHCKYGDYDWLGEKLIYVAMLREPVGRCISNYWHWANVPKAHRHYGGAKNLDDYIENEMRCNLMTRRLCGVSTDEEADVARAIARLQTFQVVGALKRFGNYVGALASYLQKPIPPIVKRRVQNSMGNVKPTDKQLQAIADANAKDVSLYRFAELIAP